MGFFDSFPRPPLPEPVAEPPRPVWAKPECVVPGTLAADLTLLHTDQVAVTLGLLLAYPTGFEFTVEAHSRHAGAGHRIGAMPRRYAPGGAETGDGLRLGLAFSDGRRAEIAAPGPVPADGGPGSLVVVTRGGTGGERSWSARFWVYPLPPPGPVSFFATWPTFGIGEAHAVLEAGQILSAAERALPLWPDHPDGPLTRVAEDLTARARDGGEAPSGPRA